MRGCDIVRLFAPLALVALVAGCAADDEGDAHAEAGASGETGEAADTGEAAETGASCSGLEARNGNEVVVCNQLGEPVLAHVVLPAGEPPSAGWGGIVLLHGSSGLFRPLDGECSDELYGRFAEWGEDLTKRGFAVIMPASFYSRGFCDYDEGAGPDYDEHERLVTRAYDAAAAASWLCNDARVDCSRLGVLGFSNGGSVAMLVMHEQLSDADDPRLRTLTVPRLGAGVAYYPGCGLDGQLSNQLDEEQLDRFFFPTGPMWVPHAGTDSLAKNCKSLRDPQVKAVAKQRGIHKDWFQLEVYPGAKHGFDLRGTNDHKANRKAREDAQARTLGKLERWLEP